MITLHRYKTLGRIALFLIILVYLLYHLFQGNRGLLALFNIRKIVSQETVLLDKLTKQNERLRHRTRLLHPKSLDLDLLEERARAVLNMAREDEIIVDSFEILAQSKPNSFHQ